MRITASPIFEFGVLAPAVIPSVISPSGSQSRASASSCFRPGGR